MLSKKEETPVFRPSLAKKEDFFLDLKGNVSKEIKIVKEMNVFAKDLEKKENLENRKEINEEMKALKKELKKIDEEIKEKLNRISLNATLKTQAMPERKGELHEKPIRKMSLINIPSC